MTVGLTLDSLERLLLWPPGKVEERSPPRTELRRVYIFGPHHSCTNALAREIPRFFSVSVENNDFQQGSPLWKHRIFTPFGLPSLEVEEDTFCICLVKDPAFWIQSLKRDPEGGTFYDILPIQVEDGQDESCTTAGPRPGLVGAEAKGGVRFVQAEVDSYDEWADYQHWERSPAWARYLDFDLPGRADVEQMDAQDLDAVKRRVEKMDYAGFSTLGGRAYLKARRPWLNEEALEFCGVDSDVAFYLYNPHELQVGDFVKLSSNASAVREAFEAGGEAWDERLGSMLGKAHRVLELPSPTVAGLPSPDGSQEGVWYFPVGVLRPVRFEAGELVRLNKEDPAVHELASSHQQLNMRLLKTLRVHEMPEPGVVVASSPSDREGTLVRLPASALWRETEALEAEDLIWVCHDELAMRRALADAGLDWDKGLAEVLGRVCLVLDVLDGATLKVALPGAREERSWLVPAAVVRKVRDASYGPDWQPHFCSRAREAAQLFGPVFFDGIRYDDAIAVWEATVHSYFDEEVFPLQQTAVIRSEDVLFNFDQVVRGLALRGLPTLRALPRVCRPLEAPAKARGHPMCTRSGLPELQEYYANQSNRHAGLTDDMVERLLRVAFAPALGYGVGGVALVQPGAVEEEFGGV